VVTASGLLTLILAIPPAVLVKLLRMALARCELSLRASPLGPVAARERGEIHAPPFTKNGTTVAWEMAANLLIRAAGADTEILMRKNHECSTA
jgi:hypothetical protein